MMNPVVGNDGPMAADRALLVVHDEEDGHLVYDLVVADDMAAACSPRPLARFPSSSGCRAFAASGGAVLGAYYDFVNHTWFHGTVMQVGSWEWQESPRMRDAEGRLVPWWPKLRAFCSPLAFGGYRDAPALLPVSLAEPAAGDDAGSNVVVRMDTILFDGIYGCEKLRLLPGGGRCQVVPLPKPPVGRLADNELAFVSAYCAVGTRVWISVTGGRGTFSLDVAGDAEAEWRTEGTWQLPFQGRGIHVPELGGSVVVGLTAAGDGDRGKQGLLCACDVGTAGAVRLRHVWPETFPSPWEECVVINGGGRDVASRPRDMPSLAYLGDGRFCICRPMSTVEPARYGPPIIAYDACCFLVVELKRRCPSCSSLELAKRGKMTYMWPPRGRQSSYMRFIQPAT